MISVVQIPFKKKPLKDFILFSHRLYENDPVWVAPLIIQEKGMFHPAKNPFFQHSEVALFLAYKGENIVGRVAAIINNNHNSFHNEKVVFFGFFDFVDEYDVATRLLEQVIAFGKAKGMNKIAGPMNFSTNDVCGMLVDGFDLPPVVMMPYNFRYYPAHMEQMGFAKAEDLLSYRIDATGGVPERLRRLAQAIERRSDFEITFISKQNLKSKMEDIKRVYNSAWEKNWGFIPMTDAELDHMASEMKSVIDPGLVIVIYKNNVPVGFSLTLRDINQAIKRARGKLFPFGVFKIMQDMKNITIARNLTMGVIPEYRSQGLEIMLIFHTFENAVKLGISYGDLGWILESNEKMNRELLNIGAVVYKRYRVYEKQI